MKTGVILLAAGSSSRLGRPKQLINYQGKTLIQKAIDEANKSQAEGLVVVLGSNPELIQTGFDTSSVPFIVNPDWQHGMSSSMQVGLRFLMEKEVINQVVLMLCDQPFVDASLIDQLITAKYTSGKGIVAASYSNTLGVPALFEGHYFEELLQLTRRGCKPIPHSISAKKSSKSKLKPSRTLDWSTSPEVINLEGM
jgi:molybdenum cofactor cytidylyltransferase